MYISKSIFVHRKLQKKKKKFEQNFFKKKMAEKKEIEIEKTAKKIKKKLFNIAIHTTYNMTYLCRMGSNEFFIICFFVQIHLI